MKYSHWQELVFTIREVGVSSSKPTGLTSLVRVSPSTWSFDLGTDGAVVLWSNFPRIRLANESLPLSGTSLQGLEKCQPHQLAEAVAGSSLLSEKTPTRSLVRPRPTPEAQLLLAQWEILLVWEQGLHGKMRTKGLWQHSPAGVLAFQSGTHTTQEVISAASWRRGFRRTTRCSDHPHHLTLSSYLGSLCPEGFSMLTSPPGVCNDPSSATFLGELSKSCLSSFSVGALIPAGAPAGRGWLRGWGPSAPVQVSCPFPLSTCVGPELPRRQQRKGVWQFPCCQAEVVSATDPSLRLSIHPQASSMRLLLF